MRRTQPHSRYCISAADGNIHSGGRNVWECALPPLLRARASPSALAGAALQLNLLAPSAWTYRRTRAEGPSHLHSRAASAKEQSGTAVSSGAGVRPALTHLQAAEATVQQSSKTHGVAIRRARPRRGPCAVPAWCIRCVLMRASAGLGRCRGMHVRMDPCNSAVAPHGLEPRRRFCWAACVHVLRLLMRAAS